MSVLIVGNILKDVYLRLDTERNHFEEDAEGTSWLDLGFNGSDYKFYRRSSMYAGAAVTLEVMERFGLSAKISGSKMGLNANGEISIGGIIPQDYRYILCNEDKVVYLTPSHRNETPWQAPKEIVDWIFVDRSTNISEALVQKITNYLYLTRQTRLAVYIEGSELSKAEKDLIEMANLVFTEHELTGVKTSGLVCKICDEDIILEGVRQKWHPATRDLSTHLTMYSILATTVFSALLSGKGAEEALLLAKLNVENSSLNGTLSRNKLEDLMQEHRAKQEDLRLLTKTLFSAGEGILAADESEKSIHRKFEAAGIEDTYEMRRDYRNIFFSTPDLPKYVSGVILYEETAKQLADNGESFVEYLTGRGVVPGIKVDMGLRTLPGTNEQYTAGLDGLDERLTEYYEMGLRFTKWRSAFMVTFSGDGTLATPSEAAISRNARDMATYARMSQEAGLVPIVEPELVYDGDYSVEICYDTTGIILDAVFSELKAAKVDLSACILKTNMALAGKQFYEATSAEEVGWRTAEMLRNHVPTDLGGVVFLSGGQSPEQATENLHMVIENGPFPWPLTYSFARAFQDPALAAWKGDNANLALAQEAFLERLVANSSALKKD